MSYNTLSDVAGNYPNITQAHLDSAELYLNGVYSPWPGVLADTSQAQDWPRVNSDGSALIDANGRELNDIPSAILRAEIEAAKLIQQGRSLLPVSVASASSASTQNSQLIETTVASGDERVTRKFSPERTETSTSAGVQTLTDLGLPRIALIDAILLPITGIGSTQSATNFYFNRA